MKDNPKEYFGEIGDKNEILLSAGKLQKHFASLFGEMGSDYEGFKDVVHNFPYKMYVEEGNLEFRFEAVIEGEKITIKIHDSDLSMHDAVEQDFDLSLTVIFSKIKSKMDYGSMVFEVNVVDERFQVKTIRYLHDSKLAASSTAEGEHYRSLAHKGLPAVQLDPELVAAAEEYMEARGLTSEIAKYLLKFYEFKKNRDFLAWIKNIHNYLGK